MVQRSAAWPRIDARRELVAIRSVDRGDDWVDCRELAGELLALKHKHARLRLARLRPHER